jgi:hypothetical protein
MKGRAMKILIRLMLIITLGLIARSAFSGG